MFKKVLKGFLVLAACFAVTAVSAKEVKAEGDPVTFVMYDGNGNNIKEVNESNLPFSITYSGAEVSQGRSGGFKQNGRYISYKVIGEINGKLVGERTVSGDSAGLWDRTSGSMSIKAYKDGDNYVVSFSIQADERYGYIQLPNGKHARVIFTGDMSDRTSYVSDGEENIHDPQWETYIDCSGHTVISCKICHINKAHAPKAEAPKQEEKHEDLSAKAFGGRKADQLSVAEQKSAVSYALECLRAGGNALPAQAVTVNVGGKAQDIAAVVAEDRNATNQQMFAQVMATRLGFKKVTALKTYDMYALSASSTVKNNAQVIKWANTGLKAGDTAFVVWYNQKLGRIELLPAVVGVDGSVAVNVPALGDVSTMTIVKADK